MAGHRARVRRARGHLRRLGLLLAGLLLPASLAACKHPEKPRATPAPLATPAPSAEAATPTPMAVELAPIDGDRTTPGVFAYYQPWFQLAPGYEHWRGPGRDPLVTGNDGLPMLAAARHPAIGPYESDDDALIGYHLLLLKGAGFAGAVVAWHGERTASERAIATLFAKARAWDERFGLRFSLMLMLDADVYAPLPPAARLDSLREDVYHVLVTYGASRVYQRLEAKPVLFFYPRPDPRRANETTIGKDIWRRLRGNVGQEFRLAYLDAGPAWQGMVDLPFAWVPPVTGSDEDGGKYLDWFYDSFAAMKARGWDLPTPVGVAYPGHEEQGNSTSWGTIPRTMDGQSTLVRTWSHAFDFNEAHPDGRVAWMQTVSWNDWGAGTEIEPSAERGSVDYEQAAAQNQRFTGIKAAPQVALTLAKAYLAGRRAGMPEDAFAPAIERFAAGEPEAVLPLLPRKMRDR